MSRKVQDLEDELKKMQLEREQLEVAYLDLQEKCRPFQVCVCVQDSSSVCFQRTVCFECSALPCFPTLMYTMYTYMLYASYISTVHIYMYVHVCIYIMSMYVYFVV